MSGNPSEWKKPCKICCVVRRLKNTSTQPEGVSFSLYFLYLLPVH